MKISNQLTKEKISSKRTVQWQKWNGKKNREENLTWVTERSFSCWAHCLSNSPESMAVSQSSLTFVNFVAVSTIIFLIEKWILRLLISVEEKRKYLKQMKKNLTKFVLFVLFYPWLKKVQFTHRFDERRTWLSIMKSKIVDNSSRLLRMMMLKI